MPPRKAKVRGNAFQQTFGDVCRARIKRIHRFLEDVGIKTDACRIHLELGVGWACMLVDTPN